MFELLTTRFENLFYKIRNKGRLSPVDLDNALREIRLALLEADVNFKVVKQFLENVRQKAIGVNIVESLTPFQQVVKIVNEELVKMLGVSSGKISFVPNSPTIIIMVVGLQGSGKTTSVVKLANFIKDNYKKKVSIIASDTYRPAAVLQLVDMAKKVNIEVYSEKNSNPISISTRGVEKFKKMATDVVIIDTAGRLHVDENMMEEIVTIKRNVKPHQIFLVLDAMTGQDAVNIASKFNEKVAFDGVILTKLDSDTRGGAVLSIYYIIKKPIRFISTGEKIDDFDNFHPDRMASRILGMGDILTLVEKAEKVIDEDKAKELEKKIYKNELNLEDFVDQLRCVRKMGSLEKIFSMIPMMNKNKMLKNINLDDSKLVHIEAIINSMTVEERRKPYIINGSRKKRIAKGSGTSVTEVNKLLRQFDRTRQLLKHFADFSTSKKFNFPLGKF